MFIDADARVFGSAEIALLGFVVCLHLRWGQWPSAGRAYAGGIPGLKSETWGTRQCSQGPWYPTHSTMKLLNGWGTGPPAVGPMAFGRESLRWWYPRSQKRDLGHPAEGPVFSRSVVSHPFNDEAVEWMGHGAFVVGGDGENWGPWYPTHSTMKLLNGWGTGLL